MDKHIYYMKRAIELAQTGIYTTRPNPAVGCVLVKHIDGNDTIIGEGFHFKAGEAHAEINALQQAKENGHSTDNATAYVTLEPCSHTGKTPPCAVALIKANIKTVVIAVGDPNPKVAGQGIQMLKDAGITVITNICENDAKKLNKGFLKVMAGGLPYVRLKIASSLDGRTAMASGESKWITGEEARKDVQHWRAISGAIITGSETVLTDDPKLNVRFGFKKKHKRIMLSEIPQPVRVILDRRGRVDMNFTMMNDGQKTIVLGRENEDLLDFDLLSVLESLRDDYQINDVLVECGGTLASSFIDMNLVDEIILYQAPLFLGVSARPMLNFNIEKLAQAKKFHFTSHKMIGNDLRLILSKTA